MSDCSPGMATQAADIGLLNFKHGYDVAFARDNQSIVDNQEDARAWGQLKLRSAQNAATFDHFINMTAAEATAAAIQTGQSEDQQTVSPIRTATGDAIAGTVGVSADAIAAFIIIGREITISALREWMAKIGAAKSVAVSFVGKLKTTAQMGAIPLLLFNGPLGPLDTALAGRCLLNVAVVLTLLSMVYYIRMAWPEISARSR